ncbi:MAG: T9SS C-terminal target domain-containing protein [Calditrichaeota bacterium]|nr:MAG: T9SS C-terminal target domain-containing protein [Calditrichota bacterium]
MHSNCKILQKESLKMKTLKLRSYFFSPRNTLKTLKEKERKNCLSFLRRQESILTTFFLLLFFTFLKAENPVPICGHPNASHFSLANPRIPISKANLKNSVILEEKDFKVFKNVLNTNAGVETITATLRAETDHFLIYVDNAESGSISQSELNIVENAFENSTPEFPSQGIREITEGFFGSPSDIDGNGKVILLIYDIRDSFDPSTGNNGFVAGYFSPTDQFVSQNGNFADILYLDSDPGLTSSNLDVFLGTAAHEYQHLLNFNGNKNQALWLNESFSELSNYICGYPVRTVTKFQNNNDINLTRFRLDLDDFADYEKVLLFGVYLYETIGYDNRTKFIEVTTSQDSGITALDNLVKNNNFSRGTKQIGDLADLVNFFGLANAIGQSSNSLGYKLDVSDAKMSVSSSVSFASHDRLPVSDKTSQFSSLASKSFEFLGGENLNVIFNGENGSRAFAIHTGANLQVVEIPTSNGNFDYDASSFHNQNGNDITKIVVTNTNFSDGNFTYSANGSGGSTNLVFTSSDGTSEGSSIAGMTKAGIIVDYPTYPIQIKKITALGGSASNVTLKFYNAIPTQSGDFVVGSSFKSVSVNLGSGLNTFDLTALNLTTDNPFFAVFESQVTNTMSFAVDRTLPLEGKSWVAIPNSQLQPIQNFQVDGEALEGDLVFSVSAEIFGEHLVTAFNVNAFLDPFDQTGLKIIAYADNPISELSGTLKTENQNFPIVFENGNKLSLNSYVGSVNFATSGFYTLTASATELYSTTPTQFQDSVQFNYNIALSKGNLSVSNQAKTFSANFEAEKNTKAFLFEREIGNTKGFEVSTTKEVNDLEIMFEQKPNFVPAIFRNGIWLKLNYRAENGKVITQANSVGIFGLVEESEALPETFILSQNFPNPFNPTTTINYELRITNYEFGKLLIFNVLGQKVKEFQLVNSKGSVIWNGTNDFGKQVSSGIYFYRIETDTQIGKMQKMVLLK